MDLIILEREQTEQTVATQSGQLFLSECRAIIAEASRLESPERAARVAIFALCVLLDGSGEYDPNYDFVLMRLNNETQELEPVEFAHHDL